MNLLNEPQKDTLRKLLRNRKSLMPHEICVMLHIKRPEAIAILEYLMQQYPNKVTRKTLIYCNCGIDNNAPPSAAIAYGNPMPETVKCDLCDEEVVLGNGIGIDEIFVLKSAIYLDKTACPQSA